MSETERNTIRKRYTTAALVLLALIAVYIVVSALVFKRVTIVYNVVIIAGLSAFWAIVDILAPWKAGDFEEKTPEQMSAYKKYAAADLLGYAGLMYFALAMTSNTSIYGALVYVVSRMLKNRFKDEFEGITHDEDEEEEAALTDEGIAPAEEETALTEEGTAPVQEETALTEEGTASARDEREDG